LTLQDESQKKTVNTVNPKLKGYGSSCRVEESTLKIPFKSTSSGPGELPIGIKIEFLGTRDTYKYLKAVKKTFLIVESLFGRSCHKADYYA
jgi:hypothetical protein